MHKLALSSDATTHDASDYGGDSYSHVFAVNMAVASAETFYDEVPRRVMRCLLPTVRGMQ